VIVTRVRIHAEPGGWWAEATDLPGCYAAGRTLDELAEALDDAVRLWQAPAARPTLERPDTGDRP
jgi:predicted RNase H-like HicB family nuclease